MELSKYDKVELTVKVLIFGITSSATEKSLLLLHCYRNSLQFIELPNLQKIAQIWQEYNSTLLPFMPHRYMAILDRPFSTLPTRQLACWHT